VRADDQGGHGAEPNLSTERRTQERQEPEHRDDRDHHTDEQDRVARDRVEVQPHGDLGQRPSRVPTGR